MVLNPHYKEFKKPYIFPIIEKKLREVQKEHPNQKIFNLGVGDICLPLAPLVGRAIQHAIDDMTTEVHGYGPAEGYSFLREAICVNEYASYGISPTEIFISDGASSDAAFIQELFDISCTVGVIDPTYPVYQDSAILSGKKVIVIPSYATDHFLPPPPSKKIDLVYLCTPNNPTGTAFNTFQLQEWVLWAKRNHTVLIIDNVYNAFITSDEIPPSIYAIEGAREVAIEIRSFSKWAGFTGLRCASMVIPHSLHYGELNSFWKQRINIKFNGVAYPIQKGAQACYQPEVRKQLSQQIKVYQSSAKILSTTLREHDQIFFGGENAPYIWWKIPPRMTSWEFFDSLLKTSRILAIPGSGFGKCGEGYIRLSCFLNPQFAQEAAHALHNYFSTS